MFSAALALFLLCTTPCIAADELTRAEGALIIAETLDIPHTDDPEMLYGLAFGVFPGDYDGKTDITNSSLPMTTEIAITVLVRYSGWNTVQYDRVLAEDVLPYVTQEGFPYYAPDPTPRSVPYIVVAMEKGLLKADELSTLTDSIGESNLRELLERYQKIESAPHSKVLYLPLNSSEEAADGFPQFIIMDADIEEGNNLSNGEDTVIDYRASGLRIYRGDTGISGKHQDYFPLGALEDLLAVGLEVPEDSFTHQSEAIYGTITNNSTTTNAVGIWGNAESVAPEARVWGGFFCASVHNGDAQAVGLEVDVTNEELSGVSPNESKTGIQIVALGNECTNGLEILTDGISRWHNGILVSSDTIAEDGTVLGLAQDGVIATGIDLSNADFTNAALQVGTNSKLVLMSKENNPAAIYTDEFDQGYLVLQAGSSGLRITNNENSQNILVLKEDGSIDPSCLVYKSLSKGAALEAVEAVAQNKLSPFLIVIMIVLCCSTAIMIYMIIKIGGRLKRLEASADATMRSE